MLKSPPQWLPRLALVLGLLFASFSMQSLIFGSAFAESQQQNGESQNESDSGAEVIVPPWCNWVLNLIDNINLEPVDAEGNVIDEFIYAGSQQTVTSTTSLETYYLSGRDGLTEQALETKCSWFQTDPLGAVVNFTLSKGVFQAYGFDVVSDEFNVRDIGMDIALDSDNPLQLTRTFDQGQCEGDGFQLGTEQIDLKGNNYDSDFPLVGLSPEYARTNNFCSANVKYSLLIPANLKPEISNTLYAWSGPTITFTSILTTDPAIYAGFWGL
jgi:hypothetical protein